MFKEFKEFAMRGSVLDLAIGVIIGVAFGAIVTSLVNDIIMPPIGHAMKGIDFGSLFVALDGKTYPSIAEAKKAGAAVIAYGNFINTVINFLIVAFVIFLVVRQVNRFKKPAAAPELPSTKECPFCASNVPEKAVRCAFCTSSFTAGAKAV
jgi:large conductance mechanosensitive channel